MLSREAPRGSRSLSRSLDTAHGPGWPIAGGATDSSDDQGNFEEEEAEEEEIAIAAGDSIPYMSMQTSPILCRCDEHGVYRSAVKKVCVDDIFDAASSVESTALQALLPVSGCGSFIEACISLADFVRVGLPNTRALTAAVTSLPRPSRLR